MKHKNKIFLSVLALFTATSATSYAQTNKVVPVKKVLPSGITVKEEPITKKSNVDVIVNNSQDLSGIKFENEQDINIIVDKQKYLKGKLTQIGEPREYGPKLEGFANNLPLVEVLKQLLPVNWSATSSKTVDVKKNVSWTGGKNWIETLDDIAVSNTLNILVDWNTKTVRLLNEENLIALNKSQEKIADIKFGSIKFDRNMNNQNVANVPVVQVADSGLPKIGKVGTWYVKEGISLKENLETILESSKIKLVYEDTEAHYMVDDGFILQGTLDGEDGVLAQIAALYSVNQVKQPLEFDFKMGGQNKVLVVTNKTYQQRFFQENN